jgi:hypothetical protein
MRRSRTHHRRGTGVDRDDHVEATRYGFDCREDAIDFFLLCDRHGARPGGLSTEIEDVSAIGMHAFGAAQKAVEVRAIIAPESASIRKRIGREVDHAHDAGD